MGYARQTSTYVPLIRKGSFFHVFIGDCRSTLIDLTGLFFFLNRHNLKKSLVNVSTNSCVLKFILDCKPRVKIQRPSATNIVAQDQGAFCIHWDWRGRSQGGGKFNSWK